MFIERGRPTAVSLISACAELAQNVRNSGRLRGRQEFFYPPNMRMGSESRRRSLDSNFHREEKEPFQGRNWMHSAEKQRIGHNLKPTCQRSLASHANANGKNKCLASEGSPSPTSSAGTPPGSGMSSCLMTGFHFLWRNKRRPVLRRSAGGDRAPAVFPRTAAFWDGDGRRGPGEDAPPVEPCRSCCSAGQ